MFEILAGSKPGALKRDTTKAIIDGAIKIIGAELRALPACLARMSPVQRALLKLHLCEAIGVIGAGEFKKKTLEPAGAPEYRPTLRDGASPR